MKPIKPSSGAGGGVKKPISNAQNIHHIKAPLNVSHGKPPRRK